MKNEHHSGWRWALALAYFVACALGHLPFTLWLVARRPAPGGGTYAYVQGLSWGLPLLALLVAAWVLWQGWRMRRLSTLLGLWGLWAAALLMWDRWLTYSLPEYLHHPQYALLAVLLARAIDPQRRHLAVGRVLFWTTLLGMADELLQYLWTTASYSEYLDFNDFLTNLIGAMAGVLLYYGRPGPQTTPAPPARLEWVVSVALAVLLALGLLAGRIVLTPQAPVPEGGIGAGPKGAPAWHLQRTVPPRFDRWHVGPYRGRYWILGPLAGMGLLLGTGGLFAWAGRRGLAQGVKASPRFLEGQRAALQPP